MASQWGHIMIVANLDIYAFITPRLEQLASILLIVKMRLSACDLPLVSAGLHAEGGPSSVQLEGLCQVVLKAPSPIIRPGCILPFICTKATIF